MVPFYGQGMNAGLEDVRTLFTHLRKHSTSISAEKLTSDIIRARALQEYTAQRTPDAYVINELAFRNYTEMRSSVRSPLYRLRKWIEERVDVWLPQLGWRTQYARISFGNERYSEVQKAVRRQGRILSILLMIVALFLSTSTMGAIWWIWQKLAQRKLRNNSSISLPLGRYGPLDSVRRV